MKKKLFTLIFFSIIAICAFCQKLLAEDINKWTIIKNVMGFSKYQEFRISYDIGTRYELYQNKGNAYYIELDDGSIEKRILSKNKIVYNTNDKGEGVGLQYSIGFGIFDYYSWNKRYFGSWGMLFDIGYIFNKDSDIATIGVGIDFGLFWIFNLSVGYGYALFTEKLPDIDRFVIDNNERLPVYKKKSISDFYFFWQMGANVLLYECCSVFFLYEINTYAITKDTFDYAHWTRDSIRFGITYKF